MTEASADTAATGRVARCNCGALSAATTGDPVGVAMCSCAACQRRTGSAFAYVSFWHVDQVTLTGEPTRWTRVADSGQTMQHFFCPTCGTGLWSRGRRPHIVSIPAGCFVDRGFPPPERAVWSSLRHDWIDEIEGIPAHAEEPR